MKGVRPYMVRALIDWIVDSDCTPYLVVAGDAPGVDVPAEHLSDGKLVLDVSAKATRNLRIDQRALSVDCRFQGRPLHVDVPIGTVVMVYARESGIGMSFPLEQPSTDDAEARAKATPDRAGAKKPRPQPPGGPGLRLVK